MLVWMVLLGCDDLDRTPPQLEVEGPEGRVTELALTVRAHDVVPGLGGVTVSVDGGAPIALEVPPGAPLEWRPEGLADGEHRFVFVATDAAWSRNEAQVEVVGTLDRSPPVVEIAEASLRVGQGRTWALWVRADEPLASVTAEAVLRGHEGDDAPRTVPLYPVDGVWRGLRGIEIEQVPGDIPFVVRAADPLGHEAELAATLTVEPTTFAEGGYIRLSRRQKRARKDTEAIERMRRERNGAYAAVFPEAAWTGPFVRPVPGAAASSPFGKYRTYSDGRKSHHTGLDLEDDPGVPVLAAAPGTVLVAGEQAIFGNVVIVNHGHQVATSYNHLEAIRVAVGDEVAAGDPVGTLGSTGQSTGPHLHWGLEVGVVAVDPAPWLQAAHTRSPWRSEGAMAASAPD